MKKVLALFCALMLVGSWAYAASEEALRGPTGTRSLLADNGSNETVQLQADTNGNLIVDVPTTNTTLISTTTFDDSTTSKSSSWTDILEYKMVGFWVVYDETEIGNAISADVTVDISVDGTQSLDGKFYDVASGTTLQTTETISADGDYVFWYPLEQDAGWTIPYVQVDLAAANTDTDDNVDITVHMFGVK